MADRRGLDVDVRALVGSPGRLLVSLSRGADLVVLGACRRSVRRPRSFARPRTVADLVALHGYPPVILIGGRTSPWPGPTRPVVVGVDGSRDGVAAVETAAVLAADARAALQLVCVLSRRVGTRRRRIGANLTADPATGAEAEEVLRAAEELARRVRGVRWVTRAVVSGRPESVLRREAALGGLLVVGRRGHGAERSVTGGSVSRGLLRSVRAPLAIVGHQVRPLRDRAADDGAAGDHAADNRARGDVVRLADGRVIPAGGGRPAAAAGTFGS